MEENYSIKLLSFIICICLVGGEIIIYDCQQLSTSFVLNNNYTLNSSLDCSRVTNYYNGNIFSGIFDGKGYQINNLILNFDNKYFGGIINQCIHCQIKNLVITNTVVNVNSSYHCGLLVGYCYSCEIKNILITSNLDYNNTNNINSPFIKNQINNTYYFNGYMNINNSTNVAIISGISEISTYTNITINYYYILISNNSNSVGIVTGTCVDTSLHNINVSNNYFKYITINECVGVLVGIVISNLNIHTSFINDNNYFDNEIIKNTSLIGCDWDNYNSNVSVYNNYLGYFLDSIFYINSNNNTVIEFNNNTISKINKYNLYSTPDSLYSYLDNVNENNFFLTTNTQCVSTNYVKLIKSKYNMYNNTNCFQYISNNIVMTSNDISMVLVFMQKNTNFEYNYFYELLSTQNYINCTQVDFQECIPCVYNNNYNLHSLLELYKNIIINGEEIKIDNITTLRIYFDIICKKITNLTWEFEILSKSHHNLELNLINTKQNETFINDTLYLTQKINIYESNILILYRDNNKTYSSFIGGINNMGSILIMIDDGVKVIFPLIYMNVSNAYDLSKTSLLISIDHKIHNVHEVYDIKIIDDNLLTLGLKKSWNNYLLFAILSVPVILIIITITTYIAYTKYQRIFLKKKFLTTQK